MEKKDYDNVNFFLLEQDFYVFKSLYQNPKTSRWVRTKVTAMIKDIKKGRSLTVYNIKTEQPIKGDFTNTNVSSTDEMTDGEIDAELAKLENQLKD